MSWVPPLLAAALALTGPAGSGAPRPSAAPANGDAAATTNGRTPRPDDRGSDGTSAVSSVQIEVRRNRPPRIRLDHDPDLAVYRGEELVFEIEVSDPDGDRASLTLLNPQPGMVFHPALDEPTPFTRELRWLVSEPSGGAFELLFDARDDAHFPQSRRAVARVRVEGAGRSANVIGDVTGDGIPDLIGSATRADLGGATDVGALYVWCGGVARSDTPHATLHVPGAANDDYLADAMTLQSQGVQLADVTGDGVLDVVARTPFADVGGVTDAGAVYVWAGGPALAGMAAPDATLTVAGASASDQLGDVTGLGLQLADVTGNGVSDVVVGSRWVDVGGTADAGAIYVWQGGGGLSGSPSPTAVLTVTGATPGDRLGFADGQGLQLADITGDGTLDVLGIAQQADVGGQNGVGAIYLWAGGPSLTGALGQTATLTAGSSGDQLGSSSGRGVRIAEVTGDSVLDVVASASLADVGAVVNVGAVYVWAGSGALSGVVAPTATLTVPGASPGDRLGEAEGAGLLIGDVSGDGQPDVVVAAMLADAGAVDDTGAVYVWNGGGGLTGALPPDATLLVPWAVTDDRLGGSSGQGVLLADVTGDGTSDVVAGASGADRGAVLDTGAVYVFAGGGLAGTVGPSAMLWIPDALAGDTLGSTASGRGVQVRDLTGDGVADVCATAQFADVSGITNAGALYVWHGGPGLVGALEPTAELTVPGAKALDQLGRADVQGVQFADLTGDGIADVVAGAIFADVGPVLNAGAIYVWKGGAGLAGELGPAATLTVPGAANFDSLGANTGQGIQLADVDGDGQLDVVAGAPQVDFMMSAFNTGAVYVWLGGVALSGAVPPDVTLQNPTAVSLDTLGVVTGQGVQLADVTGDGVLDLVGGTTLADIGGVVDTGALYVWSGPLEASSAPDRSLSVPGAQPGDLLGG